MKSTTPGGPSTRLARFPSAPPVMRPSALGAAVSIRARSRATGSMRAMARQRQGQVELPRVRARAQPERRSVVMHDGETQPPWSGRSVRRRQPGRQRLRQPVDRGDAKGDARQDAQVTVRFVHAKRHLKDWSEDDEGGEGRCASPDRILFPEPRPHAAHTPSTCAVSTRRAMRTCA